MKHITNKSLHLFLFVLVHLSGRFIILSILKMSLFITFAVLRFLSTIHLCERVMTKKQTTIEKEKYHKVTKDTPTSLLGTPVQLLLNTNISSAKYMKGTQCI